MRRRCDQNKTTEFIRSGKGLNSGNLNDRVEESYLKDVGNSIDYEKKSRVEVTVEESLGGICGVKS